VPLSSFTPRVREWFERAFDAPTPAQREAWPAIAAGENVLLSAPTGSGKTLAAFLWALDRLSAEHSAVAANPSEGAAERAPGTRGVFHDHEAICTGSTEVFMIMETLRSEQTVKSP